MFKQLLAGLIGACAILPGFGVELKYDWGPANVVADHMVGPGMHYTKIIYPKKPLILWLVTVDLTNPYAKIEQVQSRHQVPDPLRWDVMTHYKENSRPGHQVKVAWNHDFFSYDASVCIGINISEVGSNSATINVSELPVGIYIVTARPGDGTVRTAKLTVR